MNEWANEWQIVSYRYFKAYTTSAMISTILNLLLIAIIIISWEMTILQLSFYLPHANSPFLL